MFKISSVLDNVLDALVAPGFSRLGYTLRSSMFKPLSEYSLEGKTVVITGPTSGLGEAAARQLASVGANLVLVGRSADKLRISNDRLNTNFPNGKFVSVVADMGNLRSVKMAVAEIQNAAPQIHALVHNAGALLKMREVTPEGHEVTIATHVLGPHLMTTLLLANLRVSNGRVITVSSGGMYAATLTNVLQDESPEMSEANYDGTRQYAIAKRIQVTLNEMWATREVGITFASMHPGWADTPGVQTSMPTFRTVTKPFLRTSDQGADTISWLVADEAATLASGKFWSDRAIRSTHKIGRTLTSDAPLIREALWKWCDEQIASV